MTPTTIKALSVKQPWASLIASGRKTIELRTWSTNYRGPLLVCSSGRPLRGTEFEIGPLGVTLCIVDLVDVRPAVSADRENACLDPISRDFAWVLRNVRDVPRTPFKGRLGLMTLDRELLLSA